jgi:hypothetical protein
LFFLAPSVVHESDIPAHLPNLGHLDGLLRIFHTLFAPLRDQKSRLEHGDDQPFFMTGK